MFQSLFARSLDAIWLFDPKAGVFVDCNQAAVLMVGWGSKAELLQSSPSDLAPPLQPDGRPSVEVAAEATRLVERNGGHRFEWLGRRANGEVFPVEIVSTPIIAEGRPLHVIISRDISERKRTESALREGRQLLGSLADNLNDAVYRTGPDHALLFVNHAYLRMFGYDSLEELQSISRERLHVHPADYGRLLKGLEEAGKFDQELEFLRKDGSRFWARTREMTILESPGGRVLHHVGSIGDVTQRRKAEDEIRQLNATLERRVEERTAALASSEARSRTLIEHAPEAIVVFDGETGRFLECNENAVRLYGLSRAELIQKHPAEVSPEFQPDGRTSMEAAREVIGKTLAGETPVFDWTHQHSSGRLVPCEVRLVRLPGEGRMLVRGSVIDNTERKRREKIQQATFDISEAVHAAEDLENLYERIHRIIKGLMSAENFYIALFDPHTELISFPYFVDEHGGRPDPFKVSTGLTGFVLRSGKPLLADRAMNARKRVDGDTATFEGYPGLSYRETGRPAATWLGVPLSVGGQPLGVMAVQDYRDDSIYDEEDKQILTFVGAQTALAIHRKRAGQVLIQRAEQNRRHRNALLDLALLDKSELSTALPKICAGAASAMRVARVSYWSLRENGGALICESLFLLESGGVDPAAVGTRIAAATFPNYFVALANKLPLVASAVESHPHVRELLVPYLQPLGITSMLDVPVWLNGQFAGVLCHEHLGPAREWTTEEIDFASSVANMVSLAIEAAQRTRSEQALRESERKFRALFEASGQGVMLHDEHQFLEVNPATLRILGFARADEVVGKHPAELSPPMQPCGETSAVMAARHIGECLATGRARFEWTTYNAKRQEVPMDVILTRVEMEGRQIIQAVIEDISERKLAEAELLRALAREKELSALKSNFVSMVSHEFRTPLGIIMSSAEILGDYLEQLPSEERQDHLRSIARNSRRMSELMEEVLVLGRLDAGKMDFKAAPVDFGLLCKRMVEEITSATERACPIALLLDEPAAPANGDERLLQHIFLNLLANAVKYSEPGRAVEFRIRRQEREAVCEIRDRGIGIAEADLPRLFNTFQRGTNVGQRPGTGLGLVIVKRCVELHGGRITVESRLGEGTTMSVRLPIFD